ncbi:hypothetical protein G7067_03525 [Leucobacter insecticola]|uniref:Uncharacterized protein n=1 Tax=Leucobacter insecticola TaxID=2714934 RepID=A0A6G8FGQ8_9MICO|nr:hypothetical protein [Leucobacter insecticola]QIM15696.1 hypothetical protein G7067_03525 [Leucobacter insecticola]
MSPSWSSSVVWGERFAISSLEATNRTYEAELQIAVISLDAPVDPNYPTLTVRTSRYTPDRELVRAVLDSIGDE